MERWSTPIHAERAPVGAWLVLLAAGALAATSCIKDAYPGPRRPDTETILVEGHGVVIVRIDGQRIRGTRFRLLPGPHGFDVRLHQPAGFDLVRVSDGTQRTCFEGWRGHSYVIEPAYRVHKWWPEAFDTNGTAPLPCEGTPTGEP